MPELPEVETIRADLASALIGRRAVRIRISDSRLLLKHSRLDFETAFTGATWNLLNRQGKYLWVELSNKWVAVFHLRMTGQLILGNGTDGEVSKPRLTLEFNDGQRLHFCDQRRFGDIHLYAPGLPPSFLNRLGPDALKISASDFIRLVRSKPTKIKPLLMDQRYLSGVGNIYAQEALFRSGIRPARSGKRISNDEAALLYRKLTELLEQAIEFRGSSSRNYRDASGKMGQAQTLHRVYRKEGKPCPTCSTVLKGARLGGRGTVFCPRCQR